MAGFISVYRKFKLRSKLIVTFLFILILFMAFIFYNFINVFNIIEKKNVVEKTMQLNNTIVNIRLLDKDFLLKNDSAILTEIEDQYDKIIKMFNSLSKSENNQGVKDRLNSLLRLFKSYKESFDRMASYKKEIYGSAGLIERIKTKLENVKNREISLYFYKYLNNFNAQDAARLTSELSKYNDDELRDTIYKLISKIYNIGGEEKEFVEYIARLDKGLKEYEIYVKDHISSITNSILITNIVIVVFLILLIVIAIIFTLMEISRPMKGITKSTKNIKDVSKILSKVVENKTVMVMKVFNSINSIKRLFSIQNKHIVKANEEINLIINKLNKVNKISQDKVNSLLTSKKKIHDINFELQDLEKNIKNVEKTFNEVIVFSELIKEISDKSRVLSVNAGIEAANAGAYGQVLRVVAREIKMLSGEISNRSKDINTKMLSSKKEIDEALRKIFYTIQEFTKFSDELDINLDATLSIIQDIVNLKENIQNITNSMHRLNDASIDLDNELTIVIDESEKMRNNIDDLRTVRSETNNAIEDIIMNVRKITDDSAVAQH